MANSKTFSNDIIKILTKAVENKIYGSVEVYFEAGNITQITQRIINKVAHARKQKFSTKVSVESPKNVSEMGPSSRTV